MKKFWAKEKVVHIPVKGYPECAAECSAVRGLEKTFTKAMEDMRQQLKDADCGDELRMLRSEVKEISHMLTELLHNRTPPHGTLRPGDLEG